MPVRETTTDATSPTTPPGNIRIGLATQVGLAAALTAFVVAIIAFIDGDRTEETIGAIVTGALVLWRVIDGRMNQAVEQIRSSRVPAVASFAELESVGAGQEADERLLTPIEDDPAGMVNDSDLPSVERVGHDSRDLGEAGLCGHGEGQS